MTDEPILACDDVAKHFVEAGTRLDVLTGVNLRVLRGDAGSVRQLDPHSPVENPAFDITPAPLVTALITERGIVDPVAGMHFARRARLNDPQNLK